MTFAEIQTAVQANPALLSDIASGFGKELIPTISNNDELLKAVVPTLNQKGYIVRTQDEEKSYYEKAQKGWTDEVIPKRDREIYTTFENLISELTGDKKQSNEFATDFLKRKIADIKTSKIDDPVLKEQVQTLQNQLKERDTNHKASLKEIEDKYFVKELDYLFSSDLNSINIALPAHLKTDDEKQLFINSQRAMMKRDAMQSLQAERDNDGNIVFKENGKQLISTTDGKPLRPIDIIKMKYGHFLAKDDNRQQGGAGTGGNGNGSSTFTTKEEVYKFLEAKGLKPLTKAFSDEYSKIITEQKITK